MAQSTRLTNLTVQVGDPPEELHRWLARQENQWSWKIGDQEYQTDRWGDGMFVWGRHGDLHQIKGSMDFSLRGMSKSGARKKLHRYFAVELDKTAPKQG